MADYTKIYFLQEDSVNNDPLQLHDYHTRFLSTVELPFLWRYNNLFKVNARIIRYSKRHWKWDRLSINEGILKNLLNEGLYDKLTETYSKESFWIPNPFTKEIQIGFIKTHTIEFPHSNSRYYKNSFITTDSGWITNLKQFELFKKSLNEDGLEFLEEHLPEWNPNILIHRWS